MCGLTRQGLKVIPWPIAFIKKYLDDSMKKLVHNYIITRLDYCNSLYDKLPAYQLKKKL